MADYKEMYLTMVRASEEAVRTLIEAQRACEETYLRTAGDEDEETRGADQRGSSRQSSST